MFLLRQTNQRHTDRHRTRRENTNTRQNAYVCERFEGILARNFSDALLIQNSSAPMRRVAEAAAHIHWNKKKGGAVSEGNG